MMSQFTVERLRTDAALIFDAALKPVAGDESVRRSVRRQGNALHAGDRRYDLSSFTQLLVVGAGKASPQMALALEDILNDRLSDVTGVINTKYGHSTKLQRIDVIECGHPVPDQAGVASTQRILRMLQSADARTLVFCLISGGGSALLPGPAEGISLSDKQEITRLLLESGANIVRLNTVRKHLSMVKGGGLARAASKAGGLVTLILSDVIGDPLDVIASGPTAPDISTFAAGFQILKDLERARGLKLEEMLPAVHRRFEAGVRGEIPETVKPGDSVLERCQNLVVGNNRLAVVAARDKARELGYQTLVLATRAEGEAREVAQVYCAVAKEIATAGEPISPPACVIVGGETTVTIRGCGRGGRNQELVLAGAIQLAGWPGVVLFSAGTDGTDGPKAVKEAGAFADGMTVSRAAEFGLVAPDYLENNDAFHFFGLLQDLVIKGATGTNVADISLVMVGEMAKMPGMPNWR